MKSALRIKQMEENAVALFRHYHLVPPPALIYQTDRTIFSKTEVFMEDFLKLVPHHFEVWKFNKNHGLSAITGWRERRVFSMQIVEHNYRALEVDFDFFNPNHGILPAIAHFFGEVCKPGKTNSFKVMKKLKKRGVAVKDVRRDI